MSLLPILGYRLIEWKVKNLFVSPFYAHAWVSQENESLCAEKGWNGNHVCPHDADTCGFYAFHLVSQAQEYWRSRISFPGRNPNLIIAAVVGSGKVMVYPEGFRSQFCQVVGILNQSQNNPRALQRGRKYFGVPLLGKTRLPGVMSEHGQSYFYQNTPPLPWRQSSARTLLVPTQHLVPELLYVLDLLLTQSEEKILSGGFYLTRWDKANAVASLKKFGYLSNFPSRVDYGEWQTWLLEQQNSILRLAERSEVILIERVPQDASWQARFFASRGLYAHLGAFDRRVLGLSQGHFGPALKFSEISRRLLHSIPYVELHARAAQEAIFASQLKF